MNTALKNDDSNVEDRVNNDSPTHSLADEKQTYTPHHFTVDEYYQMAKSGGVFTEDSRVELVEGEVIDMVPIGSKHADWVNRLSRYFGRVLPDEVIVNVQNPVRLSDISEPEPDLSLLAPRKLPYAEAHPSAEDVLLVIEVANSSLEYDRDHKAPLYARYGIPEYWLIDIKANQLTIFSEPSDDGFRSIYRPKLDEVIALKSVEGVDIELGELFIAAKY